MTETLQDDLIVGAQAIAAFLGLTRRQVYAMNEGKHPAVKYETGLGVCARKSVLIKTFGIRSAAAE